MTLTIYVLLFLVTKHFILDFMLQPKYQWANKGTYGHGGGLVHAGQHALGTGGLIFFVPEFAAIALLVMGLEFTIHYHIDWAKMQINKRTGWDANKHPQFWYLTGFDQYLHMLTYVWILYMVV